MRTTIIIMYDDKCTGMCHYVFFSFIILTRGSNSREFIADCLNKQYQYQYQNKCKP